MQDAADGIRADRREAICCLAQCTLQGTERPGGCPVLLTIWRAPCFAQNPLLLGRFIAFRLSTAVMIGQRLEPISVDAPQQVCDRIPALAPGTACCALEARAIGHSQQGSGADHLACRISPGSAQVLQIRAFIRREGTQRMLLMCDHGRLRGRQESDDLPPAYPRCHPPATI